MRRRATIATLISAVAVLGCKGRGPGAGATANATGDAGTVGVAVVGSAATPAAAGPAGPAPTDAELEVLMAGELAVFEAMGAATDRAGGDCGRLADALAAVLADHRAALEAAASDRDADLRARAAAWMNGHADRIMGPVLKLATAGQPCLGDDRFLTVLRRFEPLYGRTGQLEAGLGERD